MTAAEQEAPPPPEALECGACGAAIRPGQEYCVECGARIAHRRGPLARARHRWERQGRRYPGDWLWLSLLALGVAAGGATAAIALTGNDARAGETIVATDRPTQATTAVTSDVAPTATAELPTSPPAPPPPAPKLISWPVGHGFTVVLSSIPTGRAGREEARTKARNALDSGLEQVGILVSDNFASLHPGYYVVFAGVYETLEEAQTAARRLRSRFPAAYEREITR